MYKAILRVFLRLSYSCIHLHVHCFRVNTFLYHWKCVVVTNSSRLYFTTKSH